MLFTKTMRYTQISISLQTEITRLLRSLEKHRKYPDNLNIRYVSDHFTWGELPMFSPRARIGFFLTKQKSDYLFFDRKLMLKTGSVMSIIFFFIKLL